MYYSRSWIAAFAVLAIGLASAAPVAGPDDLVRQGNAAYARKDYEAAVQFYGAAGERSTDPGLVALDEAAALYQLGRYPLAEQHYRFCLQDATGARRVRALYGLGNCLVQGARARDTAALREAVRCYEACLRLADLDPELAGDIRYNLEVAKLLRTKALSSSGDPHPDEQDPGNSQPKPPQDDGRSQDTQSGSPERNTATQPQTGNQRVRVRNTGQQPIPSGQEPLPGAGRSLPPVPDRDDLVPMAPEEAAAHLRRAADRILIESSEHRLRSIQETPADVPNW